MRHGNPDPDDREDAAPAAGPLRRLELSVPSDPTGIRPAVERVVRACARREGSRPTGGGADPAGAAAARALSREGRLRVAVGEALANAVEHGNGCDPGKRVRVTAEVGPAGVRVSVRDEGEGFDPAGVPDPTAPGRRDRPRGRGLLLQRRLADAVRHEDGGRRVVLFLLRA